MSTLMDTLKVLSTAEEFLEFFGLCYAPEVVNVNRLHILKRFHQYIRGVSGLARMSEAEQRELLRSLLAQAYQDFVHSTPIKEKVFKVLQDAAGMRAVPVENLRQALPH